MHHSPPPPGPRPAFPAVGRRVRAALLGLGTLLALAGPAAAQEEGGPPGSPDGAELRVWLVTAAPGSAVWERFGHNAIRVLDTRTGRDLSYNWGIFDFDQVDFVPRFLMGRMLYMMAAFPTGPMVDSYLRAGRPVALQELELTAAQKAELRSFLEWNALPENRDYFYDYFLDNCSTRARDALDDVLGGLLADRYAGEPTGTSYRFHTRRLTRMDPLVYTGMDILLGSPGDQPISVWEEMFLPMTLMQELREARVPGSDGGTRPLVRSERILLPDGTTAEAPRSGPDRATGMDEPGGGTAHPWGPPAPPSAFLVFLAAGLALGGLLLWTGTKAGHGRLARVSAGLLAGGWSLLAGLFGAILVAVLFTDHQFMAWNENLFLFTPLSLALAVLAPAALGAGRAVRAARAVGWAVAGVAVLGFVLQVAPAALLPWARQENAILFALALPVHLALAWTLQRRAEPPART